MTNFIFSLGKIDKKLFLVFSFALNEVILNFLNHYYPKEKTYQIMDSYSISLAEMLVLAIPYIIKYKEKIIKKDEIFSKKISNIKDFYG